MPADILLNPNHPISHVGILHETKSSDALNRKPIGVYKNET